jgi:hypothetical protein
LSDRKWDESGPDVDRADASRADDRAEKAAHHNDAGADDYAVGYGRPPKATRFQPGKSGNPAGGHKRKASYKPLLDQFRELLAEPVTVTVGGRPKRMYNRELLLRSMISDAQKKNPQARKQVIALLIAVGEQDRATGSSFINPDGKVQTFDLDEDQKKLHEELTREYTENPDEQQQT